MTTTATAVKSRPSTGSSASRANVNAPARAAKTSVAQTGVLVPGGTVFVVVSEAEQLAVDAEFRDGVIRLDEEKAYVRNEANTGTMADWELIS